MRRFARRLLVTASEIGLRLLPARRYAVLTGWPATEPNVIELAQELAGRGYPFVWINGPTEQALARYGIGPMPTCRRLSKRTVRAYWTFLTAELVAFTHGIYGNPRPAKGKTIVNLWHGEGPKGHDIPARDDRRVTPSTYFVGATEVFSVLEASGQGAEHVLLCGQPRLAQLHRPAPASALQRLGIDPARPFVLWMPTYRRAQGSGLVSGWTDADEPSTGALVDQFQACLGQIVAAGAQVVVKMHPLDVLRVDVPGSITVDDASLASIGVGLYEFFGAADALLTDYSSAWVDFLQLDRPIAFLVPDEAEYMAGRGLQPADVMDHLPGPKLDADSAFAFGEAVAHRADDTRAMRAHSVERFGLHRVEHPARELVDHLVETGAISLPMSGAA